MTNLSNTGSNDASRQILHLPSYASTQDHHTLESNSAMRPTHQRTITRTHHQGPPVTRADPACSVLPTISESILNVDSCLPTPNVQCPRSPRPQFNRTDRRQQNLIDMIESIPNREVYDLLIKIIEWLLKRCFPNSNIKDLETIIASNLSHSYDPGYYAEHAQ